MFRGILSTIYVDLKNQMLLKKNYFFIKKFYKKEPFVKIAKQNTLLSTNDVINTNNCLFLFVKANIKIKL